MTPALDLVALRTLLTRHGVTVSGELNATLIAGGRSNLTFKVRDDISTWVVRRPPPSGLTPSAHDMAREFRVTQALHNNGFPVAPAVAVDPDGHVMGVPVSVVGFVEGSVIRSRSDLEPLTDEQVARVSESLIQKLVELHDVDAAAADLADFGRPHGFLERQVNLWARQWDRVRSRDLVDVDRLVDALSQRIPGTSVFTLIHGDYRVDNTIVDVDDTDPVRAVVDWELSTLGDPLTDVALMCVYRSPTFDDVLGFPAAWTSSRWPSPQNLAQRYADLSGRDLDTWEFYIGLANLKLAVIAEGIAHRARTADDTSRAGHLAASAVPELIAAGHRALK